jgi:hypothetical protein
VICDLVIGNQPEKLSPGNGKIDADCGQDLIAKSPITKSRNLEQACPTCPKKQKGALLEPLSANLQGKF